MTTATETITNEETGTTRTNPWRPGRNYRLADKYANELLDCLPEHVRRPAMATCRFRILGKNANGNEYGKGFRTFLQTFGNVPSGLANDVQIRCNWIELDAHASANVVLGCFGLSVDDVYDAFGQPEEGEKMSLDLYEILARLMPDMIDETITNAPTVKVA